MVKWRTFIDMAIMGIPWENMKPKKSIKRRKHENQKIPLALSFSHGFIIKS